MADRPTLEYGSLHKFLTSAGIAVLIATGAFCWALLQYSGALLTATSDLNGLTTGGREAILMQQEIFGWLLERLPVLSSMSVIFGLTLLAAGLIGWAPRQVVADRREDAKLEAELRRASDLEREAEQKKEAAEEIASEVIDAESGDAGGLSTGEAAKIVRDAVKRRSSIDSAHLLVAEAFELAYSSVYTVEQDFVVTGPTIAAWVDLLLTPRLLDRPAWTVEIKHLSSVSFERLINAVRQAEEGAQGVQSALARPVNPLLVVVTDSGDARNRVLEFMTGDSRLRSTEALVLGIDELSSLIDRPAELVRMLPL